MAYLITPPITTRADFAKAVLVEIGICPTGADPSAEDQQDVLDRYDREWADLSSREIVSFPSNVFPSNVTAALIRYMGVVVAPLFGIPATVEAKQDAEQALTAVAGKPYSTRPAFNLYF